MIVDLVPLRGGHRLQNLAFMIDSPPEIAELAVDLHKDLIQVPPRPCQTKLGLIPPGMRLALQDGIPSEDHAMSPRHSPNAAERLCL